MPIPPGATTFSISGDITDPDNDFMRPVNEAKLPFLASFNIKVKNGLEYIYKTLNIPMYRGDKREGVMRINSMTAQPNIIAPGKKVNFDLKLADIPATATHFQLSCTQSNNVPENTLRKLFQGEFNFNGLPFDFISSGDGKTKIRQGAFLNPVRDIPRDEIIGADNKQKKLTVSMRLKDKQDITGFTKNTYGILNCKLEPSTSVTQGDDRGIWASTGFTVDIEGTGKDPSEPGNPENPVGPGNSCSSNDPNDNVCWVKAIKYDYFPGEAVGFNIKFKTPTTEKEELYVELQDESRCSRKSGGTSSREACFNFGPINIYYDGVYYGHGKLSSHNISTIIPLKKDKSMIMLTLDEVAQKNQLVVDDDSPFNIVTLKATTRDRTTVLSASDYIVVNPASSRPPSPDNDNVKSVTVDKTATLPGDEVSFTIQLDKPVPVQSKEYPLYLLLEDSSICLYVGSLGSTN
ncbi:MAG: hypothetical protein ACRC5A_02820 [Enterobacteriaceae bacterium]